MTTQHTRRSVLALTGALGAAGLVSTSASALTPSRSMVTRPITTTRGDVEVTLTFAPDKQPSSKSWYQRINVLGSGSSYTTVLLYHVGPTTLGYQIEVVTNGSVSVKENKVVAYPTSGSLIHLTVSTRGSSVYSVLRGSHGEQLGTSEYHQASRPMPAQGWIVSHSTYVSAPHSIEFNESVGVKEIAFKDEKWTLIFEDHFDGTSIDTSKWRVRDSQAWLDKKPNSWPSTNKNSRAVDCASNIEVSNGSAKIWLRPLPEQRLIWGQTIDHTSGYLDSIGTCEVQYGRWEIRCKQPVGPDRAAWGGFWLMNGGSTTTQMSDYFEIDVNEGYGKNENNRSWSRDKSPFPSHNRAETSVHFDATGKNKVNKFAPQGTDNFEDEWHTWAVEVTPENGLQFFLDGVNYFNVPASHPQLAARLTQKFALNMRLNLMTGWYWNTTSTDTERAKPLEIDYVKVWSYAV